MLLRNPADYKGGFWLSYVVDEVIHKAGSTESSTVSLVNEESVEGVLHIVLDHSPIEEEPPLVRFDIKVWSHNNPILLVRYSTTNLSKKPVGDMRLYCIMDFDIGGPSSYKDDVGKYNPDDGIMFASDANPLCVAMASRPRPDGWEINSPIRLRVDEEIRDLRKNLELGPNDIATALQWNLGNLDSNQNSAVDVVLAANDSLEGVKALLQTAWELFDKKIR